MNDDQIVDLLYHQREPMWRNTHPGGKSSEVSLRNECRDILNRFKGGEVWAGSSLTDTWMKDYIKGNKNCTQYQVEVATLNKKITNAKKALG